MMTAGYLLMIAGFVAVTPLFNNDQRSVARYIVTTFLKHSDKPFFSLFKNTEKISRCYHSFTVFAIDCVSCQDACGQFWV